jgi:hypothetical protein
MNKEAIITHPQVGAIWCRKLQKLKASPDISSTSSLHSNDIKLNSHITSLIHAFHVFKMYVIQTLMNNNGHEKYELPIYLGLIYLYLTL